MPEMAYFEITDGQNTKPFFIALTDPDTIKHARGVLSGSGGAPHLMGEIVKSTADYNPDWSYHVQPESITFFEVAMEVCDAAIGYVEDHLADAGGDFLPDCVWCPWESKLVREVTP